MVRWYRRLAVAIVLACLASCSTAVQHPERWRLRITAPDGTFVGGAVLELSAQKTTASCLGGRRLVMARIVEKHGFRDDYVAESAGVSVEDGRFYADLSLGMCDHTLTVSGSIRGNRAAGEAQRSTLVGAFHVGRFVAERLP
jgi:hypothetical protein